MPLARQKLSDLVPLVIAKGIAAHLVSNHMDKFTLYETSAGLGIPNMDSTV